MTMLIIFGAHVAMFAPAAAPMAAMLFANKDWVTPKSIMMYSDCAILAAILIMIVVGIPLPSALF